MTAKTLVNGWLRKWGDRIGFHREEAVNDINLLIGERISQCEKFWMREVAKLDRKIYRLKCRK